jgi:hypothetical protein
MKLFRTSKNRTFIEKTPPIDNKEGKQKKPEIPDLHEDGVSTPLTLSEIDMKLKSLVASSVGERALVCPNSNCKEDNPSCLENRGGSGKCNQYGIRQISIRCATCGRSSRFHNYIPPTNTVLLAQYQELIEKMKSLPKLNTRKKAKRQNSPQPTVTAQGHESEASSLEQEDSEEERLAKRKSKTTFEASPFSKLTPTSHKSLEEGAESALMTTASNDECQPAIRTLPQLQLSMPTVELPSSTDNNSSMIETRSIKQSLHRAKQEQAPTKEGKADITAQSQQQVPNITAVPEGKGNAYLMELMMDSTAAPATSKRYAPSEMINTTQTKQPHDVTDNTIDTPVATTILKASPATHSSPHATTVDELKHEIEELKVMVQLLWTKNNTLEQQLSLVSTKLHKATMSDSDRPNSQKTKKGKKQPGKTLDQLPWSDMDEDTQPEKPSEFPATPIPGISQSKIQDEWTTVNRNKSRTNHADSERRTVPLYDGKPVILNNVPDIPPPRAPPATTTKLSSTERRRVIRTGQKPSPPTQFTRIHLRVNFRKEINRLTNAGYTNPRTTCIQKFLKATELAPMITLFSMVGHSVLQLYVPVVTLDKIKEIIAKHQLQETTFATNEVPSYASDLHSSVLLDRLAYLYGRARFRALKECILTDLTPSQRQRVLEIAEQSEPKNKQDKDNRTITNMTIIQRCSQSPMEDNKYDL